MVLTASWHMLTMTKTKTKTMTKTKTKTMTRWIHPVILCLVHFSFHSDPGQHVVEKQHWRHHLEMVLSGIYRKGCWIKCHADNNIKHEEKEKTFKLSIPDGGGVEQGFCRGPQQGAKSWPDDWDQVLGGKGGWFWVDLGLIAVFSASTWSHSSSRWRQTQQGRWPQFSTSQTVLTTPPSSIISSFIAENRM